MEILYLLIPVSIVILIVAIGVFIWAVNSGQFDDLDTPAWTVLHDEPPAGTTRPRQAQSNDDEH